MSAELIPFTPNQHEITFIPKLLADLPFFNLTLKRRDIPNVIKYSGRDEAGHPLRWEVYQDTSDEIGPPAVEAHEVWYLLVKPSIDAQRSADGRIPSIIPLGGIRECLRKVGWTAGGHQARELIKALTQISFAGCVADLWVPTGAVDDSGNKKYLRLSGRFSRMSVYAIGEHHLTEDELAKADFKFELEDTLYIRLDPLEAKLQETQEQRPTDNQYLFSVNPAGRRWYELMAAKIFGVVRNKGEFCEVRYSWYVQHHHTLVRQYAHKRVRFQMDRVIKEHLKHDYVRKVEYRPLKEASKEIDYVIRYYPGAGAKASLERIQSVLRTNRKTVDPSRRPEIQPRQGSAGATRPKVTESSVHTALITQREAEDQELVSQLFRGFGITLFKSFDLVATRRDAVVKQLDYWPLRSVQIKGGLAGWMISAIQRDYAAPPAYDEINQHKAQTRAAERAISLIASCTLCDERGLIEIKSTNHQGQKTIRICTHNEMVEKLAASAQAATRNPEASPDAQNRPLRAEMPGQEKRAAEESASP